MKEEQHPKMKTDVVFLKTLFSAHVSGCPTQARSLQREMEKMRHPPPPSAAGVPNTAGSLDGENSSSGSGSSAGETLVSVTFLGRALTYFIHSQADFLQPAWEYVVSFTRTLRNHVEDVTGAGRGSALGCDGRRLTRAWCVSGGGMRAERWGWRREKHLAAELKQTAASSHCELSAAVK